MEQAVLQGVPGILAKETWTVEDYRELVKQLFSGRDTFRKSMAAFWELGANAGEAEGAAAMKVGVVRYVLCRFQEALKALAEATDNKDRRYFQALCWKNLLQYDKAAEEFERARARGWDSDEIDLELVELNALSGKSEEASACLSKLARKLGETAQVLYLRGLIDELLGFGERAVESYARAREISPDFVPATFRLAYYYDLHGQEDEAVKLYRECASRPPILANALMNLAVLYEDAGQYDMAVRCLNRILAINPNHPRARLFLKDAESSRTMYYDEDRAKRIAFRNAVLDIPVTDFELSVRARNCLKKMNIRTLGDLVRTTEVELLNYKNFGETSLKEIKDMLTSKGLHLGQAQEGEEGRAAPVAPPEPRPKGPNGGVLATRIEQIEFSVRVRRALDSLKVTTLGQLITKTEAELLACKNFGQTSLNEVRQRLAEYGLQLREAV
jgi:DNA-directed RNA polymerase subunit alpha